MLTRLYDPQSGNIWLGHQNITSLDPIHLRNRIVLVPQEPVLFAGTIAENIVSGLSPEQAREATPMDLLSHLGAATHFSRWPDGVHANVGAQGKSSLWVSDSWFVLQELLQETPKF